MSGQISATSTSSANKFGRVYQLSVQTQSGGTLSFTLPLTIEFDIVRNTLTSANTATIRIYNLSKNHRNQIRKNQNDYGTQRVITLMAGYGSNLSTVFTGSIIHAWNVREGVDFITQIEAFDGGFAFANSYSQQSFPAGTPQSTIIASMMKDMSQHGISFGGIGNISGTTARGGAISGSTLHLLNQQTGGSFFVDNGKSYVLADNEYIPAQGILTVNAQSGLLGTPVLEQTILSFDMIFEPRLVIAQLVNLQSLNPTVPDGNYKVVELHHRGMISAAVCGEAITSVGMFAPLSGTPLMPIVPGVSP